MRDPLAKARRLHKPAKPLLERIQDECEGESYFDVIVTLAGALVAAAQSRKGQCDLRKAWADTEAILKICGLRRRDEVPQ